MVIVLGVIVTLLGVMVALLGVMVAAEFGVMRGMSSGERRRVSA